MALYLDAYHAIFKLKSFLHFRYTIQYFRKIVPLSNIRSLLEQYFIEFFLNGPAKYQNPDSMLAKNWFISEVLTGHSHGFSAS